MERQPLHRAYARNDEPAAQAQSLAAWMRSDERSHKNGAVLEFVIEKGEGPV